MKLLILTMADNMTQAIGYNFMSLLQSDSKAFMVRCVLYYVTGDVRENATLI